jgi:hypothetical protein
LIDGRYIFSAVRNLGGHHKHHRAVGHQGSFGDVRDIVFTGKNLVQPVDQLTMVNIPIQGNQGGKFRAISWDLPLLSLLGKIHDLVDHISRPQGGATYLKTSAMSQFRVLLVELGGGFGAKFLEGIAEQQLNLQPEITPAYQKR